MKTAEEILAPYIETPFRHTNVVEKANAIIAMEEYADQFRDQKSPNCCKMKTLELETAKLIDQELRSIPEKYQKNLNSVHEGFAVLLEEVEELKNEAFWGEKKGDIDEYKERMKQEAIQVAAMAVRFIQELC